MNAPRAEKRDFHGWLILDKDVGQTSTAAVAALKRLFRAKKVGHAGTLDPLASGVLPIAFGEATKTVSFVMDGQKAYRFTVRWGVETDTDDSEGRVLSESAARPSPEAIRALLPNFTGRIEQTPPRYSALKIEGERAYNLAREGEDVLLAARPVDVHRLALDRDSGCRSRGVRNRMRQGHLCAGARARHGAGTRLARPCVRAPAHARWARSASRRRFASRNSMRLNRGENGDLASALLPVEAGLAAVPALQVSRADADRLGARPIGVAARPRRAFARGNGLGFDARLLGGARRNRARGAETAPYF